MVCMGVGTLSIFLFFPHYKPYLNKEQFVLSTLILFICWSLSLYSLALLQLPRTETKRYLVFGLGLVFLLSLFYFGFFVGARHF